MRLPARRQRGSFGFNMTPMIDVVFLLIIFFLVSSHLARSEAQLQLPLPEGTSGEPLDDKATRVVINVLETGTLFLAGRQVNAEQLPDLMRTILAEKGDDVQLRIRAASQVEYGYISPIVRAAAHAGIWDVNFAVVPPN